MKYSSFQEHAPLPVLKELVGKLDIDFPLPEEIMVENCEKQLKSLIDNNKVFAFYFGDEKKRPKFIRNKLQRLLLRCSEKNRATLKTMVIQQIQDGVQEYIDKIELVKSREEICQFERCFKQYLTEEQQSAIYKRLREGKDLL